MALSCDSLMIAAFFMMSRSSTAAHVVLQLSLSVNSKGHVGVSTGFPHWPPVLQQPDGNNKTCTLKVGQHLQSSSGSHPPRPGFAAVHHLFSHVLCPAS
jgi:hypothetical protein